jgi:xylan 1,4-beta-xylosidase
MREESRKGMRRRDFVRTSAAGVAVASLPLMPASARADSPPLPPKPPDSLPKYRTNRAGIDMSRTYVNPLNLPNIEVATNTSAMAPTDAGIANSTTMLPILAKDTWVEADGRTLSGRAKTGFRALTENRYRTMADFSPVNYDGTIYLYCSGNLQTNRALYSTRDYRTWQYQEMNLGVTAPTAVRVAGKYYLAGNFTPVFVADSPAGPWTQLGRFTRPDGSTFSAGDVQFFLDDDGRLYLSWNIGAPIMGAELDPNQPNQLISEPVVVVDFDPSQEWMHFGDNKQGYNFAWVEGSQIFKVGNVYYIAVAAGGTEHTSYSTGLMKSRKGPLSGYEYQDGNPIGHEIGGDYPSAVFPNAGHGGFIQDDAGNLIFFYTYVIGYEGAGFERRAGMDVCYVDNTGNIVCKLSNTPQLVPSTEPAKPGNRRGQDALADDAGLYNVSTHSQTYWASSYAPGRTPYYATDRVLSTWWEPADADTSPTLIVGLANPYNVSAIQLHWKELGVNFTARNAVKYTLEYRNIAANAWAPLVDKSANTTALPVDYLTFDEVFTHAIRLKILGTTENVKVGVQQLNVFGENYTVAADKGLLDLQR